MILGLGHFLGGFFELVLEVQERSQPGFGDFDQGLFGLELALLPEQAHPDSGADEEIAVIGLIEAGEDLHERGLAGAVGPDQPDSVAGADFEFQLAENRIAGELAAQSLSGNEDHLWRVAGRCPGPLRAGAKVATLRLADRSWNVDCRRSGSNTASFWGVGRCVSWAAGYAVPAREACAPCCRAGSAGNAFPGGRDRVSRRFPWWPRSRRTTRPGRRN